MQIHLESFAELISGTRIRHNFDDASKQSFSTPVRTVGDASVGSDVQVKLVALEDLLEVLNHLQCKDILS